MIEESTVERYPDAAPGARMNGPVGSPILTALMELDSEISEVAGAISNLGKRLEPVMTPPEPQDGASNELEGQKASSEVAAQIRAKCARMRGLKSAIAFISEHLEV